VAQQDQTTTGSESNPVSRAEQRAREAQVRAAKLKQRLLLGSTAAALVVAGIIGALLYDLLVLQKSTANMREMAKTEVEAQASQLARYWRTQTQLVDALADRPELVTSLEPGNPANSLEQRRIVTRTLERDLPGALSLRLFEQDSADLDRDAQFPIRYAELDLIQRAETGKPTLPEVVTIEGRWQINWARAIVPAGETAPLGSFLLVTDAGPLFAQFDSTNQQLGQFQLLQVFADSPVQTIRTRGVSALDEQFQAPVAGTYLQVKLAPGEALLERAAEPPSLWLLATSLTTVLLLALGWIAHLQLAKRFTLSARSRSPLLGDLMPTKPVANNGEQLTNPLFSNQDILDIAMIEEDQNVLGLGEGVSRRPATSAVAELRSADIPREIFRSYDIRGLVGEQLTPDLAMLLGQAIGSEALDQGEQALVVGRDGRSHSEMLTQALIKGILQSGCNVINIGLVPTPLMYFATFHFSDTASGVMVTASHNPKEYNGFKVVLNNAALADAAVLALRERILSKRLHQGAGTETPRAIIPAYIDRIFSDVALAGNVSLVIDAGNAVTGLVAPQLFEELGCDVIPLYCELDGEFPNHTPDPSQAQNLRALIDKVRDSGADMGVAFDGDGDRLVVVTPRGEIIWPDRLLMLFARDILARHPGADVVFDVKCSRQLNQVISSYGGRPIMWKTGHSPMKAKMVETGALIGGEYSGHIFIKDRWYGFDDGLYAMARLLEIITLRDQPIDEVFAGFPPLLTTPEIKVSVSDADKFKLIEKLAAEGDFQHGAITSIDGLRVDFPKGWGLVRASNTSPALTLRFEAEDEEKLDKLKQLFKRELHKIDSSLALDF